MSAAPAVDPRSDHVRGPDDAPVTLVEYGDFECPYCGEAFPELEEVRRRLGSRLRFVYRHFPIVARHPHAEQAAEAAEAAAAQGRFWEMHDRLFRAGRRLEGDDLVRYAEEVGLDVERFTRELDERVHLERVREQARAGAESGVTGTPTFFVDGERYGGFYDAETLSEVLADR